jgi:subfamily B ATP-binding cassette protein MsbA
VSKRAEPSLTVFKHQRRSGTPISSYRLYLRLLRYVVPYRKQFIGGVMALVVLAATEPAIPALLKPLFDGTFVARDPTYIFWVPVLFVGLATIRGLANFASTMSMVWIGGMLVHDLRREMFDKLLVLPARYYDSTKTGVLITRLTNNVMQVTSASTVVITVVVRDSLKVVGLLGYAIYLNWKLSLTVLLVGPPLVVIVRLFARRIRHYSRSLQNTVGQMTHVLQEAIQGHKVVKLFGGSDYERRRFDDVAKRFRRQQYKVKAAGAANVPIVEFLASVLLAGLIYVGASDTSGQALTPGGFAAFFAAMALLTSPIKSLTNVSQPIQQALAAAENLFDLLDEDPEPDNGTLHIKRAEGFIEFDEVRFRYPTSERDALVGLSFSIPAGRTVALVGPSGGGKSTVASLLSRFYNATGGTIRLDGVDTQQLTLASLRANLALVSQDVLLFNDTVAANIAYGIRPHPPREVIEQAARTAHAFEFIDQLPNGFDTLIGENGVMLSGGQRQRLAIARALLRDAPVLILDEATSALDAESERRVQDALQALRSNRTTLVIAHRLSTIEHADEILVIKGGRIVERGTHADLLARNGQYAELYRHQFIDGSRTASAD